MIISISGRKSSGKTTITNFLCEQGFEKISFASTLKEYVAKIYNIPLSYLYDTEIKEQSLDPKLVWDTRCTEQLRVLSNEPIPHYSDYSFSTYREAMQIIGTDILRKYDDNFHVNKTIQSLDKNKNYCADDCRFVNEKTALEKHGAVCIFIFRPSNFQYSNHASEIDLNWSMFDNIIVNNKSIKTLTNKISSFIKYGIREFNRERISRSDLVQLLEQTDYNTTAVSKLINKSRDMVVWWSKNYLIDLSVTNGQYQYDNTAFLVPSEDAAYYAGLLSADGCLKKSGKSNNSYVIELTSTDESLVQGFKKFLKSNKPIYTRLPKNGKMQYIFVCNSQYVIENLKLWNILPNKSKNNKIPDIIKNNGVLLNTWFIGLIDGDGCISISTQHKRNIHLRCIASEQVVDFLSNLYSDIEFNKYQEKNIDNLYCMAISGKKVIKLYNKIYNGTHGLPRKWDKIKDFL